MVAYFTLDKDRSNSKIRAVITYSIGKIVGVFGLHKTLRIALETLGMMDKFGLTSFELAIEIGTDILAVIGKALGCSPRYCRFTPFALFLLPHAAGLFIRLSTDCKGRQ